MKALFNVMFRVFAMTIIGTFIVLTGVAFSHEIRNTVKGLEQQYIYGSYEIHTR